MGVRYYPSGSRGPENSRGARSVRRTPLPWSVQTLGQRPVSGHTGKRIDSREKQLESDNVVLETEVRLWQSQKFHCQSPWSETKSRVISEASGLAGAGTD